MVELHQLMTESATVSRRSLITSAISTAVAASIPIATQAQARTPSSVAEHYSSQSMLYESVGAAIKDWSTKLDATSLAHVQESTIQVRVSHPEAQITLKHLTGSRPAVLFGDYPDPVDAAVITKANVVHELLLGTTMLETALASREIALVGSRDALSVLLTIPSTVGPQYRRAYAAMTDNNGRHRKDPRA